MMAARMTMWGVSGLVCALGLLGGVAPASADVSLTQKMTGKGAGDMLTRLKGNKLRMDTTGADGNTTSILLDLDAQSMTMLDAKKKEAVVMPVARLQEAVTKAAGAVTVKTKVTPTGEKKTVGGFACTVYDVGIAIPFMAQEGQPPAATLTMSGPACLSKEAHGQADFAQFYKAAVDKGFIFTPAQTAQGPGASMAKAIAEMRKAIADAGIVVEQTTEVKMEGGGMMAGLMNKMLGGTTTTTLVKVDESAIADDVFAVPAGYKVKTP